MFNCRNIYMYIFFIIMKMVFKSIFFFCGLSFRNQEINVCSDCDISKECGDQIEGLPGEQEQRNSISIEMKSKHRFCLEQRNKII